MYNRILRCEECGRHFFNWKKLSAHLIGEHGYEIPLREETDDDTDDD